MVGDVVNIEMTPYDLSKGRISYRYKDKEAGSELDKSNLIV
jgi:translation initiation factor IF-1